MSGILVVLERQDLHLLRELGSVAVLTLAVIGVIAARLEPVQTVLALSVAGAINAFVYLAVMWLAVTRVRSSGSMEGLV